MPVQLSEKQQRRKKTAKLFRAIRKTWAKIKGTKPERNPEYLAFLRTQYCAVPDCLSHQGGFRLDDMIEAAHVGEFRGLRQKCSDLEAIPLCAAHHRLGPVSHHVLGKTFWLYWGLDRNATIRKYNDIYESERA